MSKQSKAKALKRKQKAKTNKPQAVVIANSSEQTASAEDVINTDALDSAMAVQIIENLPEKTEEILTDSTLAKNLTEYTENKASNALIALPNIHLSMDIQTLKRKEAINTIKTLIQQAKNLISEKRLVETAQYQARIIELCRYLNNDTNKKSKWLTNTYQKQLFSSFWTNRHLFAGLRGKDQTKALHYANTALDNLKTLQQITTIANFNKVYINYVKEFANFYANQAKNQTELTAIELRSFALQHLNQLLAELPESKEQLAKTYNKTARQIILSYRKLMKQTTDNALIKQYRQANIQLARQLLEYYPEQPPFITNLLKAKAE